MVSVDTQDPSRAPFMEKVPRSRFFPVPSPCLSFSTRSLKEERSLPLPAFFLSLVLSVPLHPPLSSIWYPFPLNSPSVLHEVTTLSRRRTPSLSFFSGIECLVRIPRVKETDLPLCFWGVGEPQRVKRLWSIQIRLVRSHCRGERHKNGSPVRSTETYQVPVLPFPESIWGDGSGHSLDFRLYRGGTWWVPRWST